MKYSWSVALLAFGQFTQAQLVGGACSIVNTRMYFTGGAVGNSATPQNNIFDLDLLKGFDVNEATNSLQPQLLPNGARLPVYGAVFNPTLNGTNLYVYGGSETNSTLVANGAAIQNQGVDKFNLKTGEWTRSNQPSAPPLRETFAWMVTQTSLYIFGGRITNTNQLTNELWRYDVANESWTQLASSADVPPMRYCTAVRAFNDTMLVLPGIGTDGVVKDLKTVYLYNIATNTWKQQATTRSDRRQVILYKPILANNMVLIQGGVNGLNFSDPNFTAWDDLITLDTGKWEFTTHKLSSDFGSTIRIGYGAWKIGDQLVQFFGQPSPIQPTSAGTTFNPVQVIDLNTFQPVPKYTPPPPSFFNSATPTDQQSQPAPLGLILGLVFGILGLIIIVGLIVYFYRRKIKKIKEELSPPEYFGDRNSKHVSNNIPNEGGLVWSEADSIPNKTTSPRNTMTSTDIPSSNVTLTSIGNMPNSTNNRMHMDQDNRIFQLGETQLAPEEMDHRFDT